MIFKRAGQRDDAMFAALAVVDSDGSLAEIEVLNAQPHAFHEAQAGAIHELGREFPRMIKQGDDAADFIAGHNGWRPAEAAGGGEAVDGEFRYAEDVSSEKNNGIECLGLGSGRNVTLKGEVIEVTGDTGKGGISR